MSEPLPAQDSVPVSVAILLHPAAFDRFGRILRHLIVGLVDQAISLRLVSCDPRVETLKLGPVQTLLHPDVDRLFGGRHIARIIDALATQPPTVIHAMTRESYRLARTLAEELEADVILHVSSLADCEALDVPAPAKAQRCFASTEPLAARIAPRAAERIELIRPGVLASPSVTCFDESGRTPTLICTSALDRGGGVDLFIEAVAALRARANNILAFVLGEGPRESALRRLSIERQLASKLVFARPSGDLAQALQGGDIFVRPSSDGMVVADTLFAMSAGLAVVTFSSNVCDYVHDGVTALVCPSQTPAALAECLEALVRDRERARRLGTSAQEYVRAHHGVSRMAEATAAAYRELTLAHTTFPIPQ